LTGGGGVAGEPAADTLQALQRITDATLAYLPLDDLLRELLDRTAEILDADTAAFLQLDEEGTTLVARAAKGIEEEVEQGVRIPVGGGFAGRIAAERRAISIEDVDHAEILNPILREKGIRSLLGVPLLVEGRVIGVLHVGTLHPREFTERDRDLLQLAGDRAATAIENASLFEQRRLVEALQRSLVPDALPQVPGIELAAAYQPAVVGTRIGGDWYDVFQLDAGRIGLVIGDVMGRGIEAAVLMAQLRTALRAYALEGHGPAAVVERLNRYMAPMRPTRMTTLGYLVLDPEAESATMISAGHIPPLLVTPDGRAELADVEGDPPLGVARSTRFTEHHIATPAGSMLVFVTDGAVEVRGEALDAGLARLGDLAAAEPDPGRLCDAISGGAITRTPPSDDLAVLIARLHRLPDRLRTSWPADADALVDLRTLMRRWLRARGAEEDEIYDIVVATQEACANAVEHAYGPGDAAFDVELSYADRAVTVEVRDRGRWREARGTHRGRGLPMMRALMDDVEVRPAEAGTTVVLRRSLARRRP
jgi:anti-sigma regulatory factor (Ser/Thr protein kinase)